MEISKTTYFISSNIISYIFLNIPSTHINQINNFLNCIYTSLKNFPNSPLFITITTLQKSNLPKRNTLIHPTSLSTSCCALQLALESKLTTSTIAYIHPSKISQFHHFSLQSLLHTDRNFQNEILKFIRHHYSHLLDHLCYPHNPN
jgi:hypothetical protein